MPGSITALVETLVAAGATPELILAAVRTAEQHKDAAIEQSRAKARARVQKWRENKEETSRNVTQRSVATTSQLVRGEDSSSNKQITGQEENKDTSPPARSKRGDRIPDDFSPDIDAAVSEGLSRQDAERQARSFCDYWRSKPGKEGLKLDWPATWRVWYRRNISTPTPRSTSPPKQTVGQQARDELRRMGLLGNATDNQNRHEHQSDGGADSASPGIARRFAIASSR